MRLVFVRRLALKEKVLYCLLLVSSAGSAFAQDLRVPTDGRLQNLWALYQGDAPLNFAGFCSQRYPDTHSDWDQAVSSFNTRNKVQLAELNVLQAQLLSALKAGHQGPLNVDTWATIVNARLEQGAVVVSSMLASMDDLQAKPYCDQVRKSYGQEAIDEDSLKTARTAAAAAIEDLGKR